MQYIGTICEVSENQSLVRVEYLGTKTKLIPYVQSANSFKRSFSPPRVGEQAIVHQLRDGGFKYAVGAIFNQGCREPEGSSQTKEISEYEDGTIISYDLSSFTLEILSPKLINIVANRIAIKADVNIVGNLSVDGNIHATGSIIDDGGNTPHYSH